MSGLVAFTGPPDSARLKRMLGSLRHRGEVTDCLERPHASLGVCEWSGIRPPGKYATCCFTEAADSANAGNVSGTQGVAGALSGFSFNLLPQNSSEIPATRGSFCLALIEQRKLVIARDAVGTQSLYYASLEEPGVGQRWLVASEPKAIVSEIEFQKQIRPESVAQYLAFSFVPGQHTMLEGLFEAEAGWSVTLESGNEARRERLFRFEDEEGCDMQAYSDAKWARQTRETIELAVAERLTDDDPLVFLSGGLDSSIVAAELARQSRRPIRTFAIHFGKEYANELAYAASVADRIGSRHEEVLIRPRKFLPRLKNMVWHLDEPIGDPITQPNYELAAVVGQHGHYVFNGEGGDPLFGGPKNLTMLLEHWYGGIERGPNFREQAYLASYRRAYEEWSRLLTPEFQRTLEQRWEGNANLALEHVLTPFFECEKPKSFLNKLMAINVRLKGANLILPKVDRMLAAHQLVPLSPLFDDRLTKLSFRMPPQMKLRNGIEKYALKLAYEDLLPREVLERPKSGMRVPVHYWFQKELRRHAKKLLSQRKLREANIFDAGRVKQLLRYQTDEGPGRYGLRLWMLITFETWRRMIFEA